MARPNRIPINILVIIRVVVCAVQNHDTSKVDGDAFGVVTISFLVRISSIAYYYYPFFNDSISFDTRWECLLRGQRAHTSSEIFIVYRCIRAKSHATCVRDSCQMNECTENRSQTSCPRFSRPLAVSGRWRSAARRRQIFGISSPSGRAIKFYAAT